MARHVSRRILVAALMAMGVSVSTQADSILTSNQDRTLAINAWGGAAEGAEVRLYQNCPTNNPACTWHWDRGRILSDQDPTLAINAWGGAANGTVLRLYKDCPVDNPACTWAQKVVTKSHPDVVAAPRPAPPPAPPPAPSSRQPGTQKPGIRMDEN